MNIPEAIKLQTQLVDLLPEVGFNKYIASTRLGIEAFELILRLRAKGWSKPTDPLPGETE